MLKKLIKSYLPKNILKVVRKSYYLHGYSVTSYSQEGEDLVLKRLFYGLRNGFYIDVGAHHPRRFSNTYLFYKMGWKGINIDAMPGSMKAFNQIRPRDINIEKPISDQKQILTYYAFNDSALNGFSKELSDKRDGKGEYQIEFTKEIETTTLKDILNKYLPENQNITFLSIDVEGLDFKVLKSNDFEKYKPKVILIEILGSRLIDIDNNEISKYLSQYGYSIYAKTVNTSFFITSEFYEELNS